MIKNFLLTCITFVCTQFCNAEQFVLVENSIPECVIVLPKDCSDSMKYGANDLSKHLELMSGANVIVYKQTDEADIPSGCKGLIWITDKPAVGEAPVTNEAFKITTQQGKPWSIRIYGDNKRGAMYGCYAFLQDVLGCRWYTGNISKIPKEKTIVVGELKIQQKPAFEYREAYFGEIVSGNKAWLARNRMNGNSCTWTSADLDSSVGGKVIYARPDSHTMLWLVPPKKYFTTHPEYFALVNGKRIQDRQLQLCLTNPDVLKICIEGVKQWIKDQPLANIYSVSQMDSFGGACECVNCRKIRDEEGSESGPILKFVNAVAQEVGKEYPNVIIETFAYNYSLKPPKHVTPLPSVRVRICLTSSCKAHSLEAKCGETDFKELQSWSKITNQLYIYDYNTNFCHYLLLNPSMDYTKTVFKACKANGVTGYYTNGGGGLSSFGALKAYLCARLMWDPEQDADKVMNEYIDGVYGKSAPYIKELITLLISPFKKDPGIKLGNYDSPDAPYLNKDVLDKSEELLTKAYSASADEPVVLEELGKIRMWIDYTRLVQINPAGDVKNGKYIYNVTPRDLDRIDRWLASTKHYKVAVLRGGSFFDASDILTRQFSELECLSLENDKLRVDVMPTVGGKIMRLLDKKNCVDLMLPPSVLHKVEGGYESSVHATKNIRDDEFWGTKFKSSLSNNTITLKGMSPAGREITRQFTLNANKLVFKTTVKNATVQPLPVKFWEEGMFQIKSLKDINISFGTVSSGNIILDAKDFTTNWLKLIKWYRGNSKPAGKIVFKLRNTKITNQFDQEMLEDFYIYNDSDITRVNLKLFCKKVILQPGETTSFEQCWTLD